MSRRSAVSIALDVAPGRIGRGEVSAQGEAVTELSGLVVIGTPEAAAPLGGAGAPNLSVEQMASRPVLQRDWTTKFSQPTVRAAYDATVRARQVRVDGANGQASDLQMRQAEIARQNAVNRLGPYERARDYPDKRGDLKIDTVTYRRVNENGRNVLEVNFMVHNLTRGQIELPPVTLLSIDVQGFVLAGQSAPLADLDIGAGASKAFALRFHNPPTYTRAILPRFAPPLATRGYRGCDYLRSSLGDFGRTVPDAGFHRAGPGSGPRHRPPDAALQPGRPGHHADLGPL